MTNLLNTFTCRFDCLYLINDDFGVGSFTRRAPIRDFALWIAAV